MASSTAPNHHASHPPFRGFSGLVAALSMTSGRDEVTELALDLSACGPADRVIDLGCGPGAGVRVAARRAASVIGVDPAPVMLQVARLTVRRANVRWIEATAEHLPIEDRAATVALALASVHHWADPDEAAAEVRRVLAPGGRLVAVESEVVAGATGHRSHGWTPPQADAFAAICQSEGFHGVAVTQHRLGKRSALAVVGHVPAESGR